MKAYSELDEMYTHKMCPFCKSFNKCKKNYIIKGRNVTSIRCTNYVKNKDIRVEYVSLEDGEV